MSSDYGFQKVIGVEFAQDLHLISRRNISIYEHYTQRPSNIVTAYMDAVDLSIPNVPAVLFFYAPFKGKVMEKVLNNVSVSMATNPREILLIFCGNSPATIELFKTLEFQCKELKLRADWSRFIQYQAFMSITTIYDPPLTTYFDPPGCIVFITSCS